jgi:WD40 repeat protein
LRTYVGHLSVVRTVFADEYALVSGSADGTVRIWNTTTGQCEQILQQEDVSINALAICGSVLFTACADGTAKKFLLPSKA